MLEYLFQLVGMGVTLVGVVIGLRAIMAVLRPKPRHARLRAHPLPAVAPVAKPPHRRRPRRSTTDPLEEVITLLIQLPVYLVTVVQAAYHHALDLRATYVAPHPEASQKPASQAAETLRNVSETPETPPETPAAAVACDITTNAAPAQAPVAPADATEQAVITVLAKLITAGVIKSETRALETAFEVNAGGGKEYQRLKTLLKAALTELAPKEAAAFTQQAPVVSKTPQQAKTA